MEAMIADTGTMELPTLGNVALIATSGGESYNINIYQLVDDEIKLIGTIDCGADMIKDATYTAKTKNETTAIINAKINDTIITKEFEMEAEIASINIVDILKCGKVVFVEETDGEYYGIQVYRLSQDYITGEIEEIIKVGFIQYNNFKTTSSQNKNNDEIIKYEFKSHEYFSNYLDTNKYFIDSENELNKFYSIYSDKLDIDKDYLKNNSIFIQVEQVGSGSIQMKLSSVTFDNNTVNFIVDKNYPEIGTADMAFWYLVAIIPNNQLNNLNLNNWSKPSKILKITENTLN